MTSKKEIFHKPTVSEITKGKDQIKLTNNINEIAVNNKIATKYDDLFANLVNPPFQVLRQPEVEGASPLELFQQAQFRQLQQIGPSRLIRNIVGVPV